MGGARGKNPSVWVGHQQCASHWVGHPEKSVALGGARGKCRRFGWGLFCGAGRIGWGTHWGRFGWGVAKRGVLWVGPSRYPPSRSISRSVCMIAFRPSRAGTCRRVSERPQTRLRRQRAPRRLHSSSPMQRLTHEFPWISDAQFLVFRWRFLAHKCCDYPPTARLRQAHVRLHQGACVHDEMHSW